MKDFDAIRDQQLQVLDVHIVDVLAHLEALLRHSHSIQRALLKLRSEAPPPAPTPLAAVSQTLTGHSREMKRECEMLAEIVTDLTERIEAFFAAQGHGAGS